MGNHDKLYKVNCNICYWLFEAQTGVNAALINLPVTYTHESFQKSVHDFQKISRLLLAIIAVLI